MKQIPLIIDTDPGIDDAVAIALAVFNPRFDVRLITTVAGNVSIEATTTNALKLMAYYGKDVPVARGAAEPLIRQLDDASDVHGKTGMEGFDFPEPKTELLLDKHAVEAMRDEIMASAEPVTVMPIGPLTNIALLLKTLAFRCLVWVSGSGGGGAGRVVWGVWIPRRCSPPPCNCLTRGGCRAWSSVTRRTADGNCISRSGSRRVRGSPARNRGAARPRVRCMTRGSACGGI